MQYRVMQYKTNSYPKQEIQSINDNFMNNLSRKQHLFNNTIVRILVTIFNNFPKEQIQRINDNFMNITCQGNNTCLTTLYLEV